MYNASNIRRTTGASKHREQTARYLGSTDARGILNQFTELYDNALDEVIEYHNILSTRYPNITIPPLNINITITPTNEVIIEDEGRGLPCDIHPDTSEPAIYLIFEDDSAGGKGNHSQGGYSSMTSGMHGAGASVSKSCTTFFRVEARNQAVYNLQYTNGERTHNLTQIGELQPHPNPTLSNLNLKYTGTRVYYKYDDTIFSPTIEGVTVEPYDYSTIKSKLVSTIIGLPNPNAVLINLNYKNNIETINPNDYTPDKLLDIPINQMVTLPIQSSTKPPDEKGFFTGNVYLTRNNKQESTVIVNRLLLNYGVIDKTLLSTFSKYINSKIMFSQNFKHLALEEQQRYSFVVVLNLVKPEFSGQSKQNLSSSEFVPELKSQLISGFMANASYFEPHLQELNKRARELQEQQDLMKQIEIQKAQFNQQLLHQEQEKQKVIFDKNKEQNKSTLDKLQEQLDMENMKVKYKASRFPKNQCTLVLVEGGSGATVDDIIKNQPIEMLAVDGKVTNIFKNEITEESKATPLLRLIMANNYKDIKILTDADSDGLHIKILLIALIQTYCPDIVKNGQLYVVKSPYAKFRNPTSSPILVKNKPVNPSEFHFALNGLEYKQAVELGLTPITKYGGLADSFADANLNLLDLLNNPEFCEQIGGLTADDLSILTDILSTDSVTKKMFISSMTTQGYNKSGLYRLLINKLQRFKPDYNNNYNPNPTVLNYYSGIQRRT